MDAKKFLRLLTHISLLNRLGDNTATTLPPFRPTSPNRFKRRRGVRLRAAPRELKNGIRALAGRIHAEDEEIRSAARPTWLMQRLREPWVRILVASLLLIVLAMVAVLAVMARRTTAAVDQARVHMVYYRMGIEMYMHDHDGEYPDTLSVLVGKGPYRMPEIANDPWGNPYVYVYPGKRNANPVDLYSYGPDGLPQTTDDVWSER